MIMNMYAIRDCYVGFMTPQMDQNDETAKRNFAYAVNNNPGVIGFRPGDFDLYLVGKFESDSGLMEPVSPIVFVANGAQFIGDKKDE